MKYEFVITILGLEYPGQETVETFVVDEESYRINVDSFDMAKDHKFVVLHVPSGELVLRTSDIRRVDINVVPENEA